MDGSPGGSESEAPKRPAGMAFALGGGGPLGHIWGRGLPLKAVFLKVCILKCCGLKVLVVASDGFQKELFLTGIVYDR